MKENPEEKIESKLLSPTNIGELLGYYNKLKGNELTDILLSKLILSKISKSRNDYLRTKNNTCLDWSETTYDIGFQIISIVLCFKKLKIRKKISKNKRSKYYYPPLLISLENREFLKNRDFADYSSYLSELFISDES